MVSAVGSPWGRMGGTLMGEAPGAGHGRVPGGGGKAAALSMGSTGVAGGSADPGFFSGSGESARSPGARRPLSFVVSGSEEARV
jgi:hypothetical protein